MENDYTGKVLNALEEDIKAQKYKYRVYIVLKSGYEFCIDPELTENTAKRLAKLSLTKVQLDDGNGSVHAVRMEEVAYLNITKLEDVYMVEDIPYEEANF